MERVRKKDLPPWQIGWPMEEGPGQVLQEAAEQGEEAAMDETKKTLGGERVSLEGLVAGGILLPESCKEPKSKVMYECCGLKVMADDPDALKKIREHIHGHSLGTKETADECPRCNMFALRKMLDYYDESWRGAGGGE